MKQFYLSAIMFCFLLHTAFATGNDDNTEAKNKTGVRLNFLVSTKQKRFDAAPLSFQLQAKLSRLFHKKDLYVIVARSSEDMSVQIISILEKRNAMIGNIWFDSHGHFPRRHSLFEIGDDEYNYQSIRDTTFTRYLRKLSAYCDTNTNVGIGSCYGGATYCLPAVEEFPEQRMNGDSLMMGLSNVLNNAMVYASESFVLTGPGILKGKYALAGCPTRKKFKDFVYESVWEKVGEWNCYSGKQRKFTEPVTVALTKDGSILCKAINYQAIEKNKEKLVKKMSRFKRGNYNIASLYQHQDETNKSVPAIKIKKG